MPTEIEGLKKRLTAANDETVKIALVQVTRWDKSDAALAPDVERLMGHPDFHIRFLATLALGYIGDQSHWIVLRTLLEDENVMVRAAAAISLARTGETNDSEATFEGFARSSKFEEGQAYEYYRPQFEAARDSYKASREKIPEPEAIGLRTVYKRFGPWQAAVNIPALRREFPVSFHNTAGNGNYDRLQAEAIRFVTGWSEEFYRDVLARTLQQMGSLSGQKTEVPDELAQMENRATVSSIAIPKQHENQLVVVLLIDCEFESRVEIESFVFADGTVIAQINDGTYGDLNWRDSLGL